MATVLLLRHGQTALNRRGALRGQIDVPLSNVGEREASRLAKRVQHEYTLTALYASPLSRARMTAEAVAAATGNTVEIDRRFTDIDYNGWAGRDLKRLSATDREEFDRWRRNPDVPLRGADNPRVAQDRAFRGLVERCRARDTCVGIVTHDAILQLLLCRVLGVDIRSYRGLVQHTATLNEISYSADRWQVHLINSTWHLDVPLG